MPSQELRFETISKKLWPAQKERIRLLYLDAFSQPPHSVSEEKSHAFISRYEEWITIEGFQLILAYRGAEAVAFCFGWKSLKGDYWYERFLAAKPSLETLLSDCFELVDIGVSLSARGLGIGKQLLQSTVQRVPQKNLLLIVAPNNMEAKSLYLRCGWIIETEKLHVGENDERIVMSYRKQCSA